jgi:hypothetical protein
MASMRGAGIFDGDLLIIDRGVTPQPDDIVIAIPDWVLAEFGRVLAEHRRPKTEKRIGRARRSLSVGTHLVREWNGKTISVEVREQTRLTPHPNGGSTRMTSSS